MSNIFEKKRKKVRKCCRAEWDKHCIMQDDIRRLLSSWFQSGLIAIILYTLVWVGKAAYICVDRANLQLKQTNATVFANTVNMWFLEAKSSSSCSRRCFLCLVVFMQARNRKNYADWHFSSFMQLVCLFVCLHACLFVCLVTSFLF